MRHLHNKASSLLLVLLLLSGHALEFLPDSHAHEDGHACVQMDGSYFYIHDAGHEMSSPDEPSLRGITLGEDHEHHGCSFCHLVSYEVQERVVLLLPEADFLSPHQLQPSVRQLERRRERARAPPISV